MAQGPKRSSDHADRRSVSASNPDPPDPFETTPARARLSAFHSALQDDALKLANSPANQGAPCAPPKPGEKGGNEEKCVCV
jgi:hypothetical protein